MDSARFWFQKRYWLVHERIWWRLPNTDGYDHCKWCSAASYHAAGMYNQSISVLDLFITLYSWLATMCGPNICNMTSHVNREISQA